MINKKQLQLGMLVDIQMNNTVKRGYITKIISQGNSKKGVKVRLHTGEEGRVERIITKDDIRLENFKFYNRFFFLPHLYTVWNRTENSFLIFEHTPAHKQVPEKTALLFDSEENAMLFLENTPFQPPHYEVRRIHRKKPIADLFQHKPDYFRINGERKISLDRLNEWEYYFKNQ